MSELGNYANVKIDFSLLDNEGKNVKTSKQQIVLPICILNNDFNFSIINEYFGVCVKEVF